MLGIVGPGLRRRSLQSNSKFERMFQLDVQRKGRVSTHEAHEGRFTYALTPSMKCRTLTTVTIKRDEYYTKVISRTGLPKFRAALISVPSI